MNRPILAAVCGCLLLLAGCRYTSPLTASPSEDVNAWLLGEWQRKEKSGTSRLIVSPAGADRYRVQVSLAPRRGASRRDVDFEAWASRVGNTTFFTLRCLKAVPGLAEGDHVFVHAEMVDQLTVRFRTLQLTAPADSNSKTLRAEVRSLLKSGGLFGPDEEWSRIAEVYETCDGQVGVFQPVRYVKPEHPERVNY
jgi:hypothetical protein